MMQILGSRALITGGASGLGAGAARRIVAGGGRVALLDLAQSKGREAASELGESAVFVAADVTNPGEVEQAVGNAAEAMGGIDVCVNAAGVAMAHRVVTKEGGLFPLELFEFVVRVNLIGLFDVTRHVARVMAANDPNEDGERGVIVNVASIAAFEGQVGQAAYSASKGGVAAMTLPLARDLSSRGIRVNTIAPGIMDTPMLDAGGPALRERLVSVHLFPKRLGTPDDFAALVVHLIENALINGEVIRLDAGSRMGPV
jgi:3-hydroxyacyl-CoA dehydrogenase/3-hydroxy-2-methylbutyryl-CoA dehydrogenase